MYKRNFLLFIGFILLIAVAGPGVQAGDDDDDDQVTVDWQFAGASFSGVAQTGSSVPAILIHTQTKGPPGRATISGVNIGGSDPILAGNTDGCFFGADLKLILDVFETDPPFEPAEISLTATFKGLSVLNMALDEDLIRLADTFFCVGFVPARFDAVNVPIIFTGGFGRFEGATGEGSFTFQSMPAIPGSNFGSQIGTITGTVILP